MKLTSAFLFILLLFSCTKEKVGSRFAGKYHCAYSSSYYVMFGSSGSTSYELDLELKPENAYLNVIGHHVPLDSLFRYNSYSEGYGSDYFNVTFVDDSLYIVTHSGGMGGGSTSSYKGKKL